MARRIKTKLEIGNTNFETYNRNKIANMRQVIDIDRISNSLSYGVFTFDLYNVDNLPQAGSTVKLYRDDMNNPVLTYKLGKPVAKGNGCYSCTAYSFLEVLAGETFVISGEESLEGHYYNETAISTVLSDVINGSIQFTVDSTLQNETITGFIYWGNKRDVLRELLFATGGMCNELGDGSLVFTKPSDEVYAIPQNDVFAKNISVSEAPVASGVTATVFNYAPTSSGYSGEIVESPANTFYKVEKTKVSYQTPLPIGSSASTISIGESMIITSANISDITSRVSDEFVSPTQAKFKRNNYTSTNTIPGAYLYVDLGWRRLKGSVSQMTIYYGITKNVADITIKNCEEINVEDLVTLTINYTADGQIVHTETLILPKMSSYVVNAPPIYTVQNSERKGVYSTERTEISGQIGTSDASVTIEYEIALEWQRATNTLKIYACDAIEQISSLIEIEGEEQDDE